MLKLADRKQQRWNGIREAAVDLPRHAPDPAPEAKPAPRETTAVAAIVEHLAALGVEQAFGVSGGAIALLYDALAAGPIALRHFRHESGAAFAAAEASLAAKKPMAVFATTGPGLLNAITGLTAARWDGAKVVLISGATSAQQRGRWATQESSPYTLPQDCFYTKGPLFDFASRVEHVAEIGQALRRISQGLCQPGGFVGSTGFPPALRIRLLTGSEKSTASTSYDAVPTTLTPRDSSAAPKSARMRSP